MSKIRKRSEQTSPKVRAVAPADMDYVLSVTWGDGSSSRVDLTEPIFRLKHFRPLRNAARVRDVTIADWGWAISWGDDLDLSSETLRLLAEEQASAAMTPASFRAWLKDRRLTQEAAAKLLGVSKRTVAYYSTGAQPITRTVALAIKGAEADLTHNLPEESYAQHREKRQVAFHVAAAKPARTNDRYVVRRSSGWAVMAPGAERASEVFVTQRDAERRAKEIVSNRGGGEVRIQGRDGRWRDSDS